MFIILGITLTLPNHTPLITVNSSGCLKDQLECDGGKCVTDIMRCNGRMEVRNEAKLSWFIRSEAESTLSNPYVCSVWMGRTRRGVEARFVDPPSSLSPATTAVFLTTGCVTTAITTFSTSITTSIHCLSNSS